MPVYKKTHVAEDCKTLALRRINTCYDEHDRVCVSFSGGKDSTAVLNLAKQVARERGKLPLDVMFFDEEMIHTPTIDYVQRVANDPEISLRWYCIEIAVRNACSTNTPYIIAWDNEQRDKWCRPIPECAITTPPEGFKRGGGLGEASALVNPPGTCVLIGLRAQESLTRYNAVALNKRGYNCFLSRETKGVGIMKAYPIYDWLAEDVWLAPFENDWDYNRTYDIMQAGGQPLNTQRVGPPCGEQPMGRLHTYSSMFPDLWEKLCDRVPGAATAARYADTVLYGGGRLTEQKPPGKTWKDVIMERLLAISDPKHRAIASREVRQCMKEHQHFSHDPLPEEVPHPHTGHCWRDISRILLKGSLKDGQVSKSICSAARSVRHKAGITSRLQSAEFRDREAASGKRVVGGTGEP